MHGISNQGSNGDKQVSIFLVEMWKKKKSKIKCENEKEGGNRQKLHSEYNANVLFTKVKAKAAEMMSSNVHICWSHPVQKLILGSRIT